MSSDPKLMKRFQPFSSGVHMARLEMALMDLE
ncbi:hypothetical protein FOMG_18608 [Fusarium oxysporum f. sp. melonis 26406]|uniref:Uncharacterized protein n=1 Tax=Fusarium oxysporum f. sp. melonis 26406 TaxID=1089452 RepID=W9YZW5_FUSOX|nr:hypothetical protein FOMG_18608 [Fusarium oxysporum f. sp. melonis 26406]